MLSFLSWPGIVAGYQHRLRGVKAELDRSAIHATDRNGDFLAREREQFYGFVREGQGDTLLPQSSKH